MRVGVDTVSIAEGRKEGRELHGGKPDFFFFFLCLLIFFFFYASAIAAAAALPSARIPFPMSYRLMVTSW